MASKFIQSAIQKVKKVATSLGKVVSKGAESGAFGPGVQALTKSSAGQAIRQNVVSPIVEGAKSGLRMTPPVNLARQLVGKNTTQQAGKDISSFARGIGALTLGPAGSTASMLLGATLSPKGQRAQGALEGLKLGQTYGGLGRFTAPAISSGLNKFVPGVTGKLVKPLVQGTANVVEGLALDPMAGRPITKESIALDFVAGAALRPFGRTSAVIKSLDKGAVLENKQAKEAVRLLTEYNQTKKMSMDWLEQARKILVDGLGIKPKEFSKYTNEDILSTLQTSVTRNQQYVFGDLASGFVSKKDAQAGLYDQTFYRGGQPIGANKGQGISITRSKNIAEDFAGRTKGGTVERFNINKDAKMLSFDKIPSKFKETRKDGMVIAKNGAELEFQGKDEFQNIVDYAKEKGFDAVDLSGFLGGVEAEIRVINPKALVTQQPLGATKIKGQAPSTQEQTGLRQFSQLTDEYEALPGKTAPKSLIQEATLKQSKVPEADALPDIISREPIDVKSKVGIQDFFRTPDRVMKKIGLEKESNLLRKSYDNYLAELPKEVQKVIDWSKKVTPDSNKKIFQYLDGEDVVLTKNEQKVAGEIKNYLADWADKLKLPKENRISNYITHVFEKDFIKKEFDPNLAKIIDENVAGSVYDPFTQKRLGKLGYVQDTWRALDAYVKRATRKVNMDPALEVVKKASQNLELSQYKYVKKYLDRINLRPTDLDNWLDNSIKQIVGYKFGQRPVASLTRMGRQMVYRGTLGLNPGTALKNLTQGANTYAKLGERYTIKGYWDIFTKGAKELEDVGILRNNFIEDRTISATKQFLQKFDKGLFVFFDTAEKINRGAAYYGAKARALAKGLDEQAAIEAGKKMVRDTQFTFGSIDTPIALQSDVSKLLTQFQSYSLKQVEFLGEMIGNKEWAGLIRYSLAGLGLVYTVGKLIGMEPKDLIPSFRLGLPPTLNAPVEIGKAILGTRDQYGNVPSTEQRLKNVGRSLIPFIPAGTQGKKTYEGLKVAGQGYSESSSGRVRFPVETTPVSKIRGALFGQYNFPEGQRYYDEELSVLGEKQSETFKQLMREDPQKAREYYDQIIKARQEKKKTSEGLVDTVSAAGNETTYKNLEKIKALPETSEYEKAIKQKKAYSMVDDILDNLTPEQQAIALSDLGIKIEDATYYNVARQDNDLKSVYVAEEVGKIKDRKEMIETLVSFRREVNGDMILANGVVDSLFDQGLISASEKTMLKNLKIGSDGKVKTKVTGRGKKATLKKVSYTPKKIKIKSMRSLLTKVKNVKMKTRKYKFKRTL